MEGLSLTSHNDMAHVPYALLIPHLIMNSKLFGILAVVGGIIVAILLGASILS